MLHTTRTKLKDIKKNNKKPDKREAFKGRDNRGHHKSSERCTSSHFLKDARY